MLLAFVVAHSWLIWKRIPLSKLKFRNNFFVAPAVIALITVGVLRLRGGWIY